MALKMSQLQTRYQYDPLDRLSGLNSLRRFYCAKRIAMELEGDTPRRFFEHDSQPLAQLHDDSSHTVLLAADLQGSVLHALNPQAHQPQAYSPYGHAPVQTGLLSALGFNGERPDAMTGHYLLGQGYRAYNPVLMRFNSPDSWSPFGEGGINTYMYCSADPINRNDPSGHVPFARLARVSDWFNNAVNAVAGRIKTPVKDYRIFDGALETFSDNSKEGRRLNMVVHGTKENNASHVVMNNQPLTPIEFKTHLTELNINVSDYKSIRLISCYSGNGLPSFAQTFSNLMNKPVYAYKGKVRSGRMPAKYLNGPSGVITGKQSFSLYDRRGLGRILNNYQPIKFNPIRSTDTH